MMKTTKRVSRKPAPLGTIWIAGAKIQRINHDTMKWETLATCSDTPNAIQAAATKLVRKGYKATDLWVVGDVTDRKPVVGR